MHDQMRTGEGWYCLKGGVSEARGDMLLDEIPWPVGREDLHNLQSYILRQDDKMN